MGLFDRFKKNNKKSSKNKITKEKKFINSISGDEFKIWVSLIQSGKIDKSALSKMGYDYYWLEKAINERIEYEQYGDIVNNTSDEKILKEIAQNAKYGEIPILCIEKINNNQYLKEIAINHNSSSAIVSETAINKIDDPKILSDALSKVSSSSMEIALDKLDQKELIKIAKDKSKKDRVREEAINRINSQPVLMDIFKTEKSDSLRATALSNMNHLPVNFYNDIVKSYKGGYPKETRTLCVAISHATCVNEIRVHTKCQAPDYPPRGVAALRLKELGY